LVWLSGHSLFCGGVDLVSSRIATNHRAGSLLIRDHVAQPELESDRGRGFRKARQHLRNEAEAAAPESLGHFLGG
jgi:hypothetical protein